MRKISMSVRQQTLALRRHDTCKLKLCCVQELLLAYGEYPGKYRLLVWDFLLRLPHNSEAFQVCPSCHRIPSCMPKFPALPVAGNPEHNL